VLCDEPEVHHLLRLGSDRHGRTGHGATLWLCSDLILLGRPRGASYTLLEQSAVSLTDFEVASDFTMSVRAPNKPAEVVIRLSTESGAHYLLRLAPDDAEQLLLAHRAARERAAEMLQARAKGALSELQARKVGSALTGSSAALKELKDRRATRTADDLAAIRQLHSSGMSRSASSWKHESDIRVSSWTQRLRMRMSAAARELSAGSFGERSKRRSVERNSTGGLGEPPKSFRRSEGEDGSVRRSSWTGEAKGPSDGDVGVLLHAASVVGMPPISSRLSARLSVGSVTTMEPPLLTQHGADKLTALPDCEDSAGTAGSEGGLDAADDTLERATAFKDSLPRRPVLRELIRTAERNGDTFHDELLSALRRRAAL